MNHLWTIAAIAVSAYVMARIVSRAAERKTEETFDHDAYVRMFLKRESKTLESRSFDDVYGNWN